MNEKVTEMKLNVDLQCPCCYKKVKKILCKFPQIRDQIYDEKNNTVRIIVVCCNPEKIRDKLCCKGGKVIKSIEIVETPPRPPKEPKAPPENKPKEGETREQKPTEADNREPKEPQKMPKERQEKESRRVCCSQCYEGLPGGPCYQWYGRPVPPPPCYCSYFYQYGYCYNRGCYVSRCDQYFSDENPACSIM